MKYVFSYLKDYKKESILAPLFKLLEALFDLFVPLVVAKIIDYGIKEGNRIYLQSQRQREEYHLDLFSFLAF